MPKIAAETVRKHLAGLLISIQQLVPSRKQEAGQEASDGVSTDSVSIPTLESGTIGAACTYLTEYIRREALSRYSVLYVVLLHSLR